VKCCTMALKLEVSVFTTVVGTRRDGLMRFFFGLATPTPRHKPPVASAGCRGGGSLRYTGGYSCNADVFRAAGKFLVIKLQELRGTAVVETGEASKLLICNAAFRHMSSSGFQDPIVHAAKSQEPMAAVLMAGAAIVRLRLLAALMICSSSISRSSLKLLLLHWLESGSFVWPV